MSADFQMRAVLGNPRHSVAPGAYFPSPTRLRLAPRPGRLSDGIVPVLNSGDLARQLRAGGDDGGVDRELLKIGDEQADQLRGLSVIRRFVSPGIPWIQ